jgi:hypothetical protein
MSWSQALMEVRRLRTRYSKLVELLAADEEAWETEDRESRSAGGRAREESGVKLICVRTPDGKVEHVRILMDREEAMAACKTVWKSMKEEGKS